MSLSVSVRRQSVVVLDDAIDVEEDGPAPAPASTAAGRLFKQDSVVEIIDSPTGAASKAARASSGVSRGRSLHSASSAGAAAALAVVSADTVADPVQQLAFAAMWDAAAANVDDLRVTLHSEALTAELTCNGQSVRYECKLAPAPAGSAGGAVKKGKPHRAPSDSWTIAAVKVLPSAAVADSPPYEPPLVSHVIDS
jgi:hypothetical protein